jgi:hypothetical protein
MTVKRSYKTPAPDVQLPVGLPPVEDAVQVPVEVRLRPRLRRIQGHLPTEASQSR